MKGGAAGGGAIDGLGNFGVGVWFFQQAHAFWMCVLSSFQGVFWAAFRVDGGFRTLTG